MVGSGRAEGERNILLHRIVSMVFTRNRNSMVIVPYATCNNGFPAILLSLIWYGSYERIDSIIHNQEQFAVHEILDSSLYFRLLDLFHHVSFSLCHRVGFHHNRSASRFLPNDQNHGVGFFVNVIKPSQQR